MLFLDRIFENCRDFADKPAVEFRDLAGTTTVTYRRLGNAVEKTAVWLDQLGVRRGDRVAFRLPKSLGSIYIHLATCRLGAISMPLNPAYSAAELIYFLNDSGAKLLLVDDSEPLDLGPVVREAVSLQRTISIDADTFDPFIETVEGSPPQVETSPDLTALMLYTSGTTGRPKAAELSHANLTAIISSLDQAWGWRSDDVMVHVLPIFHAHGLVMGLHGALNVGASTLAYKWFDADQTLAAVQDGRCTVFMGVPTVHTRLLEAAGFRKYRLEPLETHYVGVSPARGRSVRELPRPLRLRVGGALRNDRDGHPSQQSSDRRKAARMGRGAAAGSRGARC